MRLTLTHPKLHVGPRSRPEADIKILSAVGGPPVSVAGVLVDSGADYLMLPKHIGIAAGLPMGRGTRVTINGVSGSVVGRLLTGCVVEVEGVTMTIDILFHPSNRSAPLLGRNAIFGLKYLLLGSNAWYRP